MESGSWEIRSAALSAFCVRGWLRFYHESRHCDQQADYADAHLSWPSFVNLIRNAYEIAARPY